MKSEWILALRSSQHLDQGPTRFETRCGVSPYLLGDLSGLQIEGELDGERAVRTDRPGDLPRRLRRAAGVELVGRRVDVDDRVAGDAQPPVPFGDVEVRADVAVGVPAGRAVGGLGFEQQLVRQAALADRVPRGEEAAAVGTRHVVGVPVHGAVRDLVASACPAVGPSASRIRVASLLPAERRHGITRRSSGPHSGCMPPGSDRWVAVMRPDSSRRLAWMPSRRSASSARVPWA